MKNLRFLTLGLALIALLFTACKKDDNNGGEQAPQRLTLEKSAVTVKQTESAIVRITAGNGGYKVESADKNIATAAIEQNNVKITAIAEGQTTLTVSDAKGQKAAIAVTVESNIDPSERAHPCKRRRRSEQNPQCRTQWQYESFFYNQSCRKCEYHCGNPHCKW